MGLFWDAAVWTAAPIAALLLASAAGIWWVSRMRPSPEDASQDDVVRAYHAAKGRAAGGPPA